MAGPVTQPPLCHTFLLLFMVVIVAQVSGTAKIATSTDKKSLMENDKHTNMELQTSSWNRLLSHLSDSTSESSREFISESCEGHLVKTSQGDICGVERSTTLGGPEDPKFSYVAFQGIPFAQPPVGKLRFKNPVAGLPWKGVRDGSWTPPVCPQVSLNILKKPLGILGQEDCLYLNVFIPKHDGRNLTNLPVMVFIHGGGFTSGSASSHDPRYFMSKDVISVHMNYRLGYLGLMSTEDDVAPGNLLLKDQALALHWVQGNIKAFGGDSNKVTLFGESTGSISAHFQMLNPQVEGLFSKVILQSGTSLLKFILEDDHREVTGLLASHFGCVDKDPGVLYDSQKVVTCLQKITTKDLIFAVGIFKWHLLPLQMGLRIDGEILPDHPAKLLKDGHYHMVDLIVGQNSHEGAVFVKPWYAIQQLLGDIAQNFSDVGHLSQLLLPYENHIARKIYNYYMGGVRKYTEKDADALVEMIGDVYFAIPNDIILELHARDALYGRNIFAYDFQHRGQYTYMQEMAQHVGQDWVNHADELQYLFSCCNLWFKPLEKKEDFLMRHILLDLWSNFAKYGNPTPDRSLGFIWQPASMESKSHLALKLKPHMEADKRCQVRKFFHSLDLPVNKILYPSQVVSGKDMHPLRVHDFNNQYD